MTPTDTVQELDTRPTGELHPHPRAGDVPVPNPDQYDELLLDIETRGLQVPIEILADGTIVDGLTRWKIATTLNYETVPVRVIDPGDPYDYMILAAASRRHLTKTQRAALFTLSPTWKLIKARANPQGKDTDVAAEKIGVSGTLVEKVQRIAGEEPALRDALIKDEIGQKDAEALLKDPVARAELQAGDSAKAVAQRHRDRLKREQAQAQKNETSRLEREQELRRIATNAPDLFQRWESHQLTLKQARDILDDREAKLAEEDAERNGIDTTKGDFTRPRVLRPDKHVDAALRELREAPPGTVELQFLQILEVCIISMKQPVPDGTTGWVRTRPETLTMAVERITKYRDLLVAASTTKEG